MMSIKSLFVTMMAVLISFASANGVPTVTQCDGLCGLFEPLGYFTDSYIMMIWKPVMILLERPLVVALCNLISTGSMCTDEAIAYFDIIYHGGEDE